MQMPMFVGFFFLKKKGEGGIIFEKGSKATVHANHAPHPRPTKALTLTLNLLLQYR